MNKVRFAVLGILLLVVAMVPTVFAADVVREDLPTVVGIAASDDNFDTLVAAVTAAGLVDTLSGEGPFTVFAPTDDAFAKLPAGTVEALLADPAALTEVLTYHVVAGDIGSDIAISKSTNPEGVPTVQGEQLRMKVFDGSLYLNDETLVTTTDILASNGVIHVIDSVLLPPSFVAPAADTSASTSSSSSAATGNTIVDIAVADGRFDTLVTAVTAAGLADTLSGEGPFTVFAPTDDAFAKLPAGTISSLLADPNGALTDILLFHVLSGDVSSADAIAVAAGDGEVATVGGQNLRIKVVDGDVYVDENSKVIITDIVADNGVIHVIDTVMIPGDEAADTGSSSSSSSSSAATGNTIVDIAAADGRFDTLVAAVTAAGLADTLSGEGPFTVFAPTDDAFAKLPAGTIPALLADPSGALTDILLFHVVEGEVGSDIAKVVAAGDGETITVGGQTLRVKVVDGSVYVDENSQVIIADIIADNGVIHVIDTVMIPGDETEE